MLIDGNCAGFEERHDPNGSGKDVEADETDFNGCNDARTRPISFEFNCPGRTGGALDVIASSPAVGVFGSPSRVLLASMLPAMGGSGWSPRAL